MKIVVLRNATFNLNKNNVFTNIHDIWGPRKNQIINKQNIIEWYRDESSYCRFNSEDDIFLMIGVTFNEFIDLFLMKTFESSLLTRIIIWFQFPTSLKFKRKNTQKIYFNQKWSSCPYWRHWIKILHQQLSRVRSLST